MRRSHALALLTLAALAPSTCGAADLVPARSLDAPLPSEMRPAWGAMPPSAIAALSHKRARQRASGTRR